MIAKHATALATVSRESLGFGDWGSGVLGLGFGQEPAVATVTEEDEVRTSPAHSAARLTLQRRYKDVY
jgi:hypothetical protein